MDAPSFSPTALAGPPFIGFIFHWGLFGALSIQVYLYFQVFANDPQFIKVLVYVIYLLECGQTALTTFSAWGFFVSNYGIPQSLDKTGPEAAISMNILGGLTLLVQLFYAHRVRKLSQNLYVVSTIVFIAICSFAGAVGTACVSETTRFEIIHDHHGKRASAVVGLWLNGSSACDILIAVSMYYYLRKGVRGIYIKSTRRIVSRIVRLTIETGTLTASLSLVSSFLFYIPALNPDWLIPIAITAEIYATTLLAVLNSRMNLAHPADSTASWDSEERTPVANPVLILTEHSKMRFKSKTAQSVEGNFDSGQVARVEEA